MMTMNSDSSNSETQLGSDEKSPNEWPNNIVGWNGPNDTNNPMNWSRKKKLGITVLLGLTTMGSSFAFSSFSPPFDAVSMEFGVSEEVVILTLSLYVLGFAFGPLVSPFYPKIDAKFLLRCRNVKDGKSTSFESKLSITTSVVCPYIRALRKKDINPSSIFHLRHLPHRRCNGRKYPDYHAMSILRWLVRFGTTFERSRCNGKSLG